MANKARTIRLNEFQRDTLLAAAKSERTRCQQDSSSPITLKRLAISMLDETILALEALDFTSV